VPDTFSSNRAADTVQPPFNPYEQWLGITAGRPPADYYELLGLDRFENRVGAITSAADTRIARVRGVRPGSYVNEWQRLLDQLNQAKRTLLDPTAKARYDAELRGRASGGALPRERSETAGSEPFPAGLSPASGRTLPDSLSAARTPPAPIPCAAGVERSPHSTWNSSPTPLHIGSGGLNNMPMGPAADQPVPRAIPVQAGSDALGSGCSLGAGENLFAAGAGGASSRPPWRPARTRSVPLRVSAVLLVLIAIAAALAHRLHQQRQQKPTMARGQVAYVERAAERQRRPPKDFTRPGSPSPDRDPTDSGAVPRGETQRATGAAPTLNTDPRDDSASGFVFDPPTRQPDKPGDMGPSAGRPAGPESPAKIEPRATPATLEPDVDPEKRRALLAAIEAVRTAMADRDLEAARRQLGVAAAKAQTDAERSETARLEVMVSFLAEFWKRMAQVVAGLETGEEFLFGDEPIIVVEATAGRVVFRGRGKNWEYAVRDIPARMVMRLAETYLRDPQSRALYGVFLAVDPKGDPERARQLWETAAQAGVEVGALLEGGPDLQAGSR
jgi:hypothetical protein